MYYVLNREQMQACDRLTTRFLIQEVANYVLCIEP